MNKHDREYYKESFMWQMNNTIVEEPQKYKYYSLSNLDTLPTKWTFFLVKRDVCYIITKYNHPLKEISLEEFADNFADIADPHYMLWYRDDAELNLGWLRDCFDYYFESPLRLQKI
jgi:hypothetical protein